MAEKFIEDKTFTKVDYSTQKLINTEFDNCIFSDCNFEGADLSDSKFVECKFEGCNFSNANLENASLQEVEFANCKLLGLNFTDCNTFLFAVGFRDCNLGFALFNDMKLKGTRFKSCNLEEADFSEADLTGATLDDCNLTRTIFEYSILEKVDFRTAYGYSIDPENNRIAKAKFSKEGIAGLLGKYDIVVE